MQNDIVNNNQLLSIGEASEYLGISIDTLRRWEKKGKLETLRSPGGHRYFKKENLDKVFGKKYERAQEISPRKTKNNFEKNINTPPEEIEKSDDNKKLKVEDEKNPPQMSNSIKSIGIPPWRNSSILQGKSPDNINPNSTANESPKMEPFSFPSSESPVSHPSASEVKIPEIPMIKIVDSDNKKVNKNISNGNKIEQVAEIKSVPKQGILEPRPTTSDTASARKQFNTTDKVLTPASTEKEKSKENKNTFENKKILYSAIAVGVFLTVGAITYFLMQIPTVPISPIP